MNYEELFLRIQGYLENDFPTFTGKDSAAASTNLTTKNQIDTFIKQAEQRIYNSVQFPNFRKNYSSTLTPSTATFTTPSDFLAVYEFSITDPATSYQEFLLNKDVSYIRASYPNPATTGVPKYYALYAATSASTTILLAPTPTLGYTYQLNYFYYPESITTAGTTWLGENFDLVLLYGSLVEGYTYMKGEADVIANYAKRYEEAMILAKRLGDGMDRRDAYRSGQVRMSVN